MKKLLLVGMLLGAGARAMPLDRKTHFIASYAVSYTTASLLEEHVQIPWLAGLGAGILVGAFKEMTDEVADAGDFGMDILGAATGALLHYSVKFE